MPPPPPYTRSFWCLSRSQEARGYPIGLISSYIGGTPDECWSSHEALASCPGGPTGSNAHMDMGDCWYSMITPLLRTPIFGAIWYQGETDTVPGGCSQDRSSRYNCTFPAMVHDWRSKFSQASLNATAVDFPFGVVQLAPWGQTGHDPDDGCGQGQSSSCQVAQLRWSQTASKGTLLGNAAIPRSFMAVTTDLADFSSPYGSIHPRHKIAVGTRLAFGARSVAYGKTGPDTYWTGPVHPAATVSRTNGDVQVQFRNCASGGIVLRETVGFEVEVDGVWMPAAAVRDPSLQARCAVGLDVTTESARAAAATRVRFNWDQVVCFANATKDGTGTGRCAVYSGGLPAPPFISNVTITH